MTCTRIALAGADRQQLAAQIARMLQDGELCVLPTETVYGLAVLPSHAGAIARARELKGRDADKHFTWHVAERAQADALAATGDVRVQRLLQRYWPGPLTVVLPARAGGHAGVRMPAHEFTRSVIERTGPLWLTSVNRGGQQPLCDAAAIAQQFGDPVRLLVDDGPSPLGVASTVVRCTGPRLEVLREGILSAGEVLHTAAAVVLFVCTGNTCRSPMAEALAKDRLARDLGVGPDELLARGIVFASAGTGTIDDMPASDGSCAALAELGLDLSTHQSRLATKNIVQRADRIYGMTESHLRAVQALWPAAADKSALLAPDGRDIADPHGGDLADYRCARDAILAAVQARLPEWRALLPAK